MPENRAAESAGVDSAGIYGAVAMEQMKLLFSNAADVPVNLINAALVACILWPLYPAWVVVSWLGVFCLVSGARALLKHRFAREHPDARSGHPWARLFIANAFIAGCLWGLTAATILVTPESVYYMFIIFVLGGTMAGGVVCTAAYKPATYAFIFPTILPAIAALLIHGGSIELVMAIMLALFSGAIMLTGVTLNASIVETFRLRIAQQSLMGAQNASEVAMADAQSIAHLGSWSIDLLTGTSTWSLEAYRVLGLDPATFTATLDGFLANVHPDDRAGVEADMAHLIEGKPGPSFEHRVIMPDESVRSIRQTTRIVFDAGGRVIGLSGTAQDITDQKAAEAKLRFANSLLESEMEASPDGIIVIGPDRRVVLANQHIYAIFRVEREGLAGHTLDGLVLNDALSKAAPLIADTAAFAATANHMLEHPTESGDDEYLLTDGRIVTRHTEGLFGEGGEYLGRVWYFRDVTEARHAAAKLELANSLLQTQMDASPDGTAVFDDSQRLISYSRRLIEIWNVTLEQLEAGDTQGILATVMASVKDGPAFADGARSIFAHPEAGDHDELELIDGRTIERQWRPLRTQAGDRLGLAFFFRDITERKRAEAETLRLANHDALTGLANRAVFVEAIDRAIASSRRSGTTFAVLYLDLDHFKDVNDTLGHPVGDELLAAVARRLQATTRGTDLVARFGGDEFAIIVPDINDEGDPALLAEKLIDAFERPFSLHGNDVQCGVSIGIALYGEQAPDAETLLSHADVALYGAKAQGRGSFRFFNAAMDVEVQERVKLGAELRVAIDAGQLFLVYQPEVAVDDGRITGVEALVRWRHPLRGVLLPDAFVPIAERIGVISKLGYWVLLEACSQGRRWIDAGVPEVRISVNVSTLQFRSPLTLEADIAGALAQSGLPARLLELEVSESLLVDSLGEYREQLARLRKSGVQIAIGDFGSAYSSLDRLRKFPGDRIKIARSFIALLGATPGDAAIVKATIEIAREMGIPVIAGGVETEAQRNLLAQWGCAEVQGFHFASPLDSDDATALLRLSAASPVA